jgi:hypothetical protein
MHGLQIAKILVIPQDTPQSLGRTFASSTYLGLDGLDTILFVTFLCEKGKGRMLDRCFLGRRFYYLYTYTSGFDFLYLVLDVVAKDDGRGLERTVCNGFQYLSLDVFVIHFAS